MRTNYGLFNEHEDNGNLLILFSDADIDVEENREDVSIYYHRGQIVGYAISNFIRYAKIKYSGIVFLPSKPLIDVINSVLENNGLETLEFKKQSGYIVKSDDGVKKVYALEGTFLRDKTISKGRFCTYHDLYITSENENDLIVIDEDIKEGTDFFQMEEK